LIRANSLLGKGNKAEKILEYFERVTTEWLVIPSFRIINGIFRLSEVQPKVFRSFPIVVSLKGFVSVSGPVAAL